MSTMTIHSATPNEVHKTLQLLSPNFSPYNVLISVGAPERYTLIEVRRKDLLAALGAEPDESDYAEVLAENASLGAKLAKTLRERDTAIKDRDAAERERDGALGALRDAEEADGEPRTDQDQIDRSWALERAAEVLGGLVSIGALPRDFGGAPLIHLAEWLVGDQEADRG